jgi:putative SOS response-associated peptidase YedK
MRRKKFSKPWAVSLSDDGFFAFGGIWDMWKGQAEGKNDIIVESFSIITTDPNQVLKPFHSRCPLIIKPKDYAAERKGYPQAVTFSEGW